MGKEKLKILVVSHHYYPAIGGAENYATMLSEELARRGHDVTVYTTNSIAEDDMQRISFKFPFFHRAKNKSKLKLIENINKVKVHRFDISNRFYSFNWIPEMYKSFKNMNFDVVNAHGYHLLSTYKAFLAAKKRGIPFVLSGIDVTVPPTLPWPAKILKKIYDRTKGRWMLNGSDAITSLTKEQIKQYNALGIESNKISVISPCIDAKKYKTTANSGFYKKYGLKKTDKILLSVGRLVEHKGVQDVIEMLPALIKKHPDLKFIVVGADHGYKNELEEIAVSTGVSDNVVFTGKVDENDLKDAYAAANIFVLPSRMEGYGIVMLEAMASGTPCVAHDIENVRDVFKDKETGYLAKDSKRMSTVLSQLLKNKKELERLRKNCLKYMKTRSIESAGDKLENVYKSVI